MIVGLASTLAADTIVIPEMQVPPTPLIVEPTSKTGFFYVRFAAAEDNLAHAAALVPGLGIGYRRLAGNGAADISFSGIGINAHKNSRYFWTAPKISYILYSTPDRNESFYYGAGLAWGGAESESGKNKFNGIIPSIACGYEFMRKSSVLGFAEFNISQPALAVYTKGVFPGPVAELTIGCGF